jgi:hypothetical protein
MEGCTAGIPDDILSDDQKKKGYIKEIPQDAGKPSPVPYSLILQRPSMDLPQDGVEKFYMTGASKDIDSIIKGVSLQIESTGLNRFIKDAFESGHYRLEVIIGDLSIKIYKHPNNV